MKFLVCLLIPVSVAFAQEQKKMLPCRLADLASRNQDYAKELAHLKSLSRIRPVDQFPTEESVREALFAIHKAFPQALMRKDFLNGSFDSVLTKHFGTLRTGRALRRAIGRFYDDLPQAFEANGLEFSKARPKASGSSPKPTSIPNDEHYRNHPLAAKKIAEAEDWARVITDPNHVDGAAKFRADRASFESRQAQLFDALHSVRTMEKSNPTDPVLHARIETLTRALELIHHPLRLVFKRRWAKYSDFSMAQVEEAISWGLRRAILKFDPHRGYKFSSYATPWVRGALIRAYHRHNEEDVLVNRYMGERNFVEEQSRTGLTAERTSADEYQWNERRLRIALLEIYEATPDPAYPLRIARNAEILRRVWGVGLDELDYAEPYSMTELARVLGISRERVDQLAKRAMQELEVIKQKYVKMLLENRRKLEAGEEIEYPEEDYDDDPRLGSGSR